MSEKCWPKCFIPIILSYFIAMVDSEIPNFFECMGCHALYLRIPTTEFLCDRCMGTVAHILEDKFIIMCPICHKYWPKHVIRVLHLEGICSCPRPNCEGILVARKIIIQKVVPPPSKSENEKPDNPESGVSIEDQLLPEDSKEKITENGNQQNLPSIDIEPKPETNKPEQIVAIDSIPPLSSTDNKSLDSSPIENIPIQPGPTFDGPIDPSSVISHLDLDRINSLYQTFLAPNQDWENVELVDYIAIFESLFDSLKSAVSPIVENPVQFIFYIGALYGDLDQIRFLCQYFDLIIHSYPSTKIIFLGNYINHNPNDWTAFTLLCLFKLKFPNNVVLLRGVEEIADRANERGFWTRCEQIFTKKHDEIAKITNCYHLVLSLFAYLPLIHIGSMNQGQIRIFSSASGIPFLKDTPDNPIILDDYQKLSVKHLFHGKEFDDISQMILTSVPNENLSSLIQSNPELDGLYFGPTVFSIFLKANNLHYMVRGSEIFPEGAKFTFNSLICSLFSASKLYLPDEKLFTGKILRLTLGQPPMILDATLPSLQKDLENTFGISDI
jgi:hypothetical protein